MVGGSAVPPPHQPLEFLVPISQVITTAASLHLGHFIHHHFISPSLHLDLLLQSSLKSISYLGDVPRLKDVLHKSFISFKGINFFHWPENTVLAASSSYIRSFSGEGSKNKPGNVRRRSDLHSRRGLFSGRDWTNILLGVNVLVYIAQIASQGKLILWGAKVNSLINEGQLWRLATSSFLHANIGHLMVNCYSLNSIGPTVENICGPRRYLAVYMSSAIASSAMSYWLCKAPAVGASGAIFGLVGSFAVFILRHRGLIGGGTEDLQHIARVIVLNMGIGLLSQGIDNWGHFVSSIHCTEENSKVDVSWGRSTIQPSAGGVILFLGRAVPRASTTPQAFYSFIYLLIFREFVHEYLVRIIIMLENFYFILFLTTYSREAKSKCMIVSFPYQK